MAPVLREGPSQDKTAAIRLFTLVHECVEQLRLCPCCVGNHPPRCVSASWGHGGGMSHSLTVLPPRPTPCYLYGPQIVVMLVAVQDDVVGHAETLPDSQVIEEGRLAEGVAHLHYGHVCGGSLKTVHACARKLCVTGLMTSLKQGKSHPSRRARTCLRCRNYPGCLWCPGISSRTRWSPGRRARLRRLPSDTSATGSPRSAAPTRPR